MLIIQGREGRNKGRQEGTNKIKERQRAREENQVLMSDG